ncbi:hypothetical protein [Niveibacterium sp. SC-1]|uniref:hypothetical protein n=1 Tax=Niveibacterium sp. SC-1 TaxID=3135646 RepID=UPI00311D2E07
MREKMPLCAEWVDALREAFGADEINTAMRAGLKDGSCWFREGEHYVGKPGAEEASERLSAEHGVSGDALVVSTAAQRAARKVLA